MAVIHISHTDAASDFNALMARAIKGDEIFIDGPFPVVIKRAMHQPGKLLSEMIAAANARNSGVTLDEDFARDLEEAVNSHREPLDPPSWD